MRGSLKWVFLFLLLGGISVGLYYVRFGRDASLYEIQQRGILRVGLDAGFPPFEMVNDAGEIVGLDPDIAQAIADDLGVTVQFVNIGFDGLYDALLVKRVDILLSALPIDPYRTHEIAYSSPYFNAGQVLVTRREDIHSVEELAGKEVAVEWGSPADMEARRLKKTIPNLHINPQPDVQSVLQFDIAIVDYVDVMANPNLHLVLYLTNEWYAAALRKEDRSLLNEVNNLLSRLQRSGELERLQQKWAH